VHSKNLIHRDIKSENLLVNSQVYLCWFCHVDGASDDDNRFIIAQWVVKLCDFGFARAVSHGLHRYTICGSMYFNAPELLLGKVSIAPLNGLLSLLTCIVFVFSLTMRRRMCLRTEFFFVNLSREGNEEQKKKNVSCLSNRILVAAVLSILCVAKRPRSVSMSRQVVRTCFFIVFFIIASDESNEKQRKTMRRMTGVRGAHSEGLSAAVLEGRILLLVRLAHTHAHTHTHTHTHRNTISCVLYFINTSYFLLLVLITHVSE
jgi:serine/threonine protein kinase